MRKFLFILLVLLIALAGAAQAGPDTLKTGAVQDTTKQFMEAPESLKKLIEEITIQKEEVSSDADIEIDGLLFDETKTKSGRDFYELFYSAWKAPADAKNYSIHILEKPYRLMTTLVEIKINETTVFQSFLQPRGDIIEQLAQQAVAQTQLYLANYEELMRQLKGEDQSGTGIF
jgi:curli production assembly/transport component CsgE